jgi:iron(III) transport system substrate-binding protein
MRTALSIAFLALFASCGPRSGEAPEAATADSTAATPAKEVNVYSHRHYETDKKLFALFTERTGIAVKVILADDDQVLTRMEQEGANGPCDVLITSDAGRLGLARMRGLLQPVTSAVLSANVPAHLRDPEGHWFGLTMRARVFAYDKTKVDPARLRTYDDLMLPRWRGKVLVRPSESTYNQSLLAAMIANTGEEHALAWAMGVTMNMARPPKGNDTDQLLAIGEGLGEVAISNSYYIARLMRSDDPAKQKAKSVIGVVYPDMNGHGTHVNISGAGVAKHAKNRDHAIQLIEFLSGDEAQALFAEGNNEFPVKPGVPLAGVLQQFGPFTPDTLDLSLLAKNNAQAVKLFDLAGWH